MTTTETTINKQAVLDYLDRTQALPFYIASGDCRSENIKLVRFKDGVVEYEGKTYFQNWYGKKDSKPQREGLMYAWLVEKKFKSYPTSPLEKSAKELADILGDYTYPTFCVQSFCGVDENYVPQISDISVYPVGRYRNGIELSYYQSGRSGLVIESLYILDFEKFLEYYVSKNYILTDGFKHYLVYMNDGVDFAIGKNPFVSELNEVLDYRESNYDIDDNDDYEYSLHSLSLHKSGVDQINKIIKKYFTAYKGEKYVK